SPGSPLENSVWPASRVTSRISRASAARRWALSEPNSSERASRSATDGGSAIGWASRIIAPVVLGGTYGTFGGVLHPWPGGANQPRSRTRCCNGAIANAVVEAVRRHAIAACGSKESNDDSLAWYGSAGPCAPASDPSPAVACRREEVRRPAGNRSVHTDAPELRCTAEPPALGPEVLRARSQARRFSAIKVSARRQP